MALNQMRATLLRPVLALLAIAGLLTLAGCGGGSGAPNNPFAPGPVTPGPLFVLPPSMTVYTGTPATLTISGGAPPYQAFSSNGTALPVTQSVSGSTVVLLANNVAANTTAVITIQDSIGQTATSTITVSPAPLLNTLTVTPARTTCGTNTICSGDTAIAAVQVTGPTGAGIPNRQVRFDVVTGAFGIQSSNPAQPLVPTLTVVSDANGNARVVLQATVNAPTQSAQLRATDVTTGNTVTAAFTIVQQTDGSAILSVVPGTATITGADNATCSVGFRIDYFIYGGTPPYHVASSFPTAVTILNTPVNVSGGSFEALTNGTCVNPLTFTIVDATGRQTTATLINQPGTAAPPTPPAPPAGALTGSISPSTFTACGGKTFAVLITNGKAPYSVFSSDAVAPVPAPTIAPQPLTAAGQVFISNLVSPASGQTTYGIHCGRRDYASYSEG